jgi:hypothetical protein
VKLRAATLTRRKTTRTKRFSRSSKHFQQNNRTSAIDERGKMLARQKQAVRQSFCRSVARNYSVDEREPSFTPHESSGIVRGKHNALEEGNQREHGRLQNLSR